MFGVDDENPDRPVSLNQIFKFNDDEIINHDLLNIDFKTKNQTFAQRNKKTKQCHYWRRMQVGIQVAQNQNQKKYKYLLSKSSKNNNWCSKISIKSDLNKVNTKDGLPIKRHIRLYPAMACSFQTVFRNLSSDFEIEGKLKTAIRFQLFQDLFLLHSDLKVK
ncbi:hypothetical protein MSG28_002800 [Choristoneura fumiferana]|uniref:Uncharacterized protein n=1 Tax=Choristoneura fumiferana TaxID=7141 RepID=A0ACC0JJC7_CHOFU|nr:hypothetical protein MSG28_002800 [Choristoneura fumiferana]